MWTDWKRQYSTRNLLITGSYIRRGRHTCLIEKGKLADLVILSENPLDVSITEAKHVKHIQVLETIKEGVTIWKGPSTLPEG